MPPPRSTGRVRVRRLGRARAVRLGAALGRLLSGLDASRRLGFDPLEFPRSYPDPADAEVAGLVAACLAYGRADLFRPQVAAALAAMAPSPARFAESLAAAPDASAFAAFRYRFNRPEDLAALVAAAGWLRRTHGSLGGRFAELYAAERGAAEPLRAALTRFSGELREAPPVAGLLRRRGRRGLKHLCPDPALPGACKRWNLYLRWMVRGPDGVDLGLWRGVPPSALVVPLDTHLFRIARYLGLTDRRDPSWRTAAEITAGLRAVDGADPVRFDFALCHLGMSGACPPRRSATRCARCPLRPVCRARARPVSGAGEG